VGAYEKQDWFAAITGGKRFKVGFMRKALFVYTGGLSGAAGIKANSKKERTAKAMEKQVRLQRQILKQQASLAVLKVNVTCPKCSAALVSPVGDDIECPECGFRMRVWATPETTAAAPAMHASPAPSENARSTLDVVALTNVDPKRKIATIKVVREVTGLGLKESKAIVDTCEVIECADHEEALALKAELERVGATVALRGSPEATDVEPDVPETTGGGMAGELERLADLHRNGALNDDEFAAAKKRVLGT
jgi:large subunit ribosomal protein L7/L12